MDTFFVAFYNTENLFDTIDDPYTDDDAFTPDGYKHWTEKRYWQKIKNIAKVIGSMSKNNYPSIVGLAEIENANVLNDLIHSDKLQDAGYHYVHEDSPDKRGIDVALLYDPDEFNVLYHEIFPVRIPEDYDFTTRDILYVKGKMFGDELLHVFINHWSSRREGREETEYRRVLAAKLLREQIDHILEDDMNAKVLVMGDMNDEPVNKSLNVVLNASNHLYSTNPYELYNLMYNMDLKGEGTHFYSKNFNMLDNIIVSHNVLHDKKGFSLESFNGGIFKPPWIGFHKTKGDQLRPDRTYGGSRYHGGYSDHFPVYCTLTRK